MSYLDRQDLASDDAGALNADGLGAGESEGLAGDGGEPASTETPLSAARFMSKGFSRGATPDNLLFLPSMRGTKTSASEAAGDICPVCGELAVVGRGSRLICERCGAASGKPG